LKLSNNPADYHYTNQSGCDTVPSIDDKADFNEVIGAMKTVGFDQATIDHIFDIVGGYY